MSKPLDFIIATLFISIQSVVASNFNVSINVQERCEICTNYLSVNYLSLNGIETYDGFEGFIEKYEEYKKFGIDDPEVLCILTDMCPLYEELVISLNLIGDDSAMELQEITEKELFSLNPMCFACKKLVSWVIKQLQRLHSKRKNKGVIRGFIAKGCKYLIKPLRNPCRNFIIHKSGPIVKALVKHLGPKLACMAAKAC